MRDSRRTPRPRRGGAVLVVLALLVGAAALWGANATAPPPQEHRSLHAGSGHNGDGPPFEAAGAPSRERVQPPGQPQASRDAFPIDLLVLAPDGTTPIEGALVLPVGGERRDRWRSGPDGKLRLEQRPDTETLLAYHVTGAATEVSVASTLQSGRIVLGARPVVTCQLAGVSEESLRQHRFDIGFESPAAGALNELARRGQNVGMMTQWDGRDPIQLSCPHDREIVVSVQAYSREAVGILQLAGQQQVAVPRPSTAGLIVIDFGGALPSRYTSCELRVTQDFPFDVEVEGAVLGPLIDGRGTRRSVNLVNIPFEGRSTQEFVLPLHGIPEGWYACKATATGYGTYLLGLFEVRGGSTVSLRGPGTLVPCRIEVVGNPAAPACQLSVIAIDGWDSTGKVLGPAGGEVDCMLVAGRSYRVSVIDREARIGMRAVLLHPETSPVLRMDQWQPVHDLTFSLDTTVREQRRGVPIWCVIKDEQTDETWTTSASTRASPTFGPYPVCAGRYSLAWATSGETGTPQTFLVPAPPGSPGPLIVR